MTCDGRRAVGVQPGCFKQPGCYIEAATLATRGRPDILSFPLAQSRQFLPKRPGRSGVLSVIAIDDTGKHRHVSTGTQDQSEYLRDPDVQLMLRVKGGDEAAFSRLVSNYQDRLISIFANLVGDQQAAE